MPLYIHTNYYVPILIARFSTGVWKSAPAFSKSSPVCGCGGYKASIYLPTKAPQPFSHILWNKRNISQCHRSFSPSLHVFTISEHPLDQRLLLDPRKRLTVLAVLRQLLQMAYLGVHYKSNQTTDLFFFFFNKKHT